MKIKHLLAVALMAIGGSAWAQEVTWPLDKPSTLLTDIGITTSSTGVTLNPNGGWYYLLNQSGNYATLSNNTFVTSNTNAEPVYFNTSTGWLSQVWMITSEGYVYMPGSNTWTTNTNGTSSSGNKNWKYTLSNGKYKLNNTGKHGSDGKYLAPNGNGTGQVVYADKTANTEWSLIPAYKVELIEKLNNTYSTYVDGNSSEQATTLKTTLEGIYNDFKNTSPDENAYNGYVSRISAAVVAYNPNAVIVNREFETATWNEGWVGTTNTNDKKSAFVKKTGAAGMTGVCAEMWDASALNANTLSQTVKQLPAGVYSLSVKAIAQNIDLTLFAQYGDSEEQSTTFRSTDATVQTVWFKLDATSDVTIGVKLNAGGSSGAKWVAVDDFSLEYFTDFPIPEAVSGKMNSEVAQAQTNAIAAFEAYKSLDNYDAALAAIKAAQASKDFYASFKVALDAQGDLLDKTNLYTTEEYTSYNNNYTTLLGK